MFFLSTQEKICCLWMQGRGNLTFTCVANAALILAVSERHFWALWYLGRCPPLWGNTPSIHGDIRDPRNTSPSLSTLVRSEKKYLGAETYSRVPYLHDVLNLLQGKFLSFLVAVPFFQRKGLPWPYFTFMMIFVAVLCRSAWTKGLNFLLRKEIAIVTGIARYNFEMLMTRLQNWHTIQWQCCV